MKKISLYLAALMLIASACTQEKKEETTLSGLKRSDFQTEVNGKKTDLFILKNKNGLEACITNYGGRIVSLMVPDKEGKMRDVELGFGNIQDYMKNNNNFGATIGRYGNRIKLGKTTIDGVECQFPQNNNGHCLHGGPNGFDTQMFDARQIDDHTLELSYLSKDGEAGFPGNLNCKVTFTLSDDNGLELHYQAETDRTTIVNLTNHSYFNLDGNHNKMQIDNLLTLNADGFTPVDSTMMTTGEILPVEGTPMDFRTATAIGERISDDYIQLKNGRGYDHNWVLNTKGDISQCAAILESPNTGIVMHVYTTEPGMQVYTGNFLEGAFVGKNGTISGCRTAVCLETQKYPDTPNKPDWPSALLRPGEKYDSRTIYRFSVDK